MRHREGVGIPSDLAHERAVLIELEQVRSVSQSREHIHLPSANCARSPSFRRSDMPAGSFRKFGSDFHGICGAVGDASAWRQLAPSAGTGLRTSLGTRTLNGDLPLGRRSLLRPHAHDEQQQPEAPHHTRADRIATSEVSMKTSAIVAHVCPRRHRGTETRSGYTSGIDVVGRGAAHAERRRSANTQEPADV